MTTGAMTAPRTDLPQWTVAIERELDTTRLPATIEDRLEMMAELILRTAGVRWARVELKETGHTVTATVALVADDESAAECRATSIVAGAARFAGVPAIT